MPQRRDAWLRATIPGVGGEMTLEPDPGLALANERVQTNVAGQAVRKLKTPWRDGTTRLVMSPLEFLQRLAARAIEERSLIAGATPATAPGPLSLRAGHQ